VFGEQLFASLMNETGKERKNFELQVAKLLATSLIQRHYLNKNNN
jgi:hypothetical protein